MRLRHACLVMLAVALLAPAGARADNHWGDVRFAASASAGSALGGFEFSLTKTIKPRTIYDPLTATVRKIPPRVWNVVVDGNVQFGKDVTQWSGFVGVRRNLVHDIGRQRIPFLQGLIGLAGDHESPRKEGAHGMLVTGLGCDFLMDRKKKDGTYKELLVAYRVQLDWIASLSGNVDPYARLSFGIVFRFDENFKPLAVQ